MRVVYLGTPEFAVPALQKLLEHSYEVCCVYTQPDRPSGRGQKLQPSPVKICALSHGIPVYQPEKIRLEENRAVFEDLRPDFIVVAAYGQILPAWLLQCARYAPVNIHASLLPRHRGAAPVAWSIMSGDAVTGITTMLMQEKLDAGPILMQQEIPISLTATTGELTRGLADIGADLLVRTLREFEKGAVCPVEQEESKATWAPRIHKSMAEISWQMSAMEIHNRIRALNPWPAAFCPFRSARLQIWRSLPEDRPSDVVDAPGTFLGASEDGVRVQCGNGTVLRLIEVQLPAKSRIPGRAFASGARLRPGERIE